MVFGRQKCSFCYFTNCWKNCPTYPPKSHIPYITINILPLREGDTKETRFRSFLATFFAYFLCKMKVAFKSHQKVKENKIAWSKIFLCSSILICEMDGGLTPCWQNYRVPAIGPALPFNLLSVPCPMAQFKDDFEKFNGHGLAWGKDVQNISEKVWYPTIHIKSEYFQIVKKERKVFQRLFFFIFLKKALKHFGDLLFLLY